MNDLKFDLQKFKTIPKPHKIHQISYLLTRNYHVIVKLDQLRCLYIKRVRHHVRTSSVGTVPDYFEDTYGCLFNHCISRFYKGLRHFNCFTVKNPMTRILIQFDDQNSIKFHRICWLNPHHFPFPREPLFINSLLAKCELSKIDIKSIPYLYYNQYSSVLE